MTTGVFAASRETEAITTLTAFDSAFGFSFAIGCNIMLHMTQVHARVTRQMKQLLGSFTQREQ